MDGDEEANPAAERSESPERQLLAREEYEVVDEEGGSASCQLDLAFDRGCVVIVVEPRELGKHVIRWIRFGNFLHKSAVLASTGALVALPFLSDKVSIATAVPLGSFGVCCAVVYAVSWQFDPCSKYQVDYRGVELSRVPSHELQSHSPVVLVRRNDVYRKVLHNTLALAVAGYLAWRAYKYYNC